MKVLIIGGTRFLGYHLTRALLRENFEVTLFNRGKTRDDFGPEIERIHGDRKDYKHFFDIFRGKKFDVVIDLIGYDLQDAIVAEEAFRDCIGQYIFISTGQVYLITENKHQPARETDYDQDLIECPEGEEAGYNYGLQKRQIEDFLVDAFQSRRFPSVRFRCPIIHGPRDYTLRLYSYLLRIADGNPLIIPEGRDNIIRHVYVADVVGAIKSAMSRESVNGQVFNLAQNEVLVLSEFVARIAGLMERKTEIIEIPPGELLANDVPLDISPFSGKWVSYLDPSLAQQTLDFHSTPLNEWLPVVIKYFMEEYSGSEPDNYRYRTSEIRLVKKWKE